MRAILLPVMLCTLMLASAGAHPQDDELLGDTREPWPGMQHPGLLRDHGDAWESYEEGLDAADEGCLEKAVELIHQAICLAPEVGHFHLSLGFILARQNCLQEAVREMELARKYGPATVVSHADWALQDLGVDHHSTTLRLDDHEDAPPSPGPTMPDFWAKDPYANLPKKKSHRKKKGTDGASPDPGASPSPDASAAPPPIVPSGSN